jgi:hypothetical protein
MATNRVGFPGMSVAAALLLLGAAPVVRAAADDPQERVARKACLSGNYQKGVDILTDLFLSTRNPVYIYNQARCYEQNDRCGDAIPRFREYLRKAAEASPDELAEAEKHITDCQALLRQGSTAAAARESAHSGATSGAAIQTPPPGSSARVASPPGALASASTPATPLATDSVASAPRTGRGLRITGIAVGAAGIASIAAGVYFYTRARFYSDKVSKQVPPNPSDQSSGKNAEAMQWVCYSIGGAALATGVLLYVLGWPGGESHRQVVPVAPLVGPGLAGLSAQGAF